MKALLKLLYFILALVIILLLAGLFLPKDAHIESSATIGASMEIVFDQVNDFKNWEKWSPWLLEDSTMIFEFGDKTAGTGAYCRWTSKKSGSGNQTIKKSIPDKRIDTYIDFGDQGNANSLWKFDNTEKNVRVTWSFESFDMRYMERYFMFLFENSIRKNLARGLQNLKNFCEELRLSRVSDVEILTLEVQPAMVIVDSSNLEDMGEKMSMIYNQLTGYLERRELHPTGAAFTLYYARDPNGLTKFACGFPIEKRTWGWKQYNYLELPGGKVAMITHWGSYGSEKPWIVLDQYLKDHNLQISGEPWEVYLSDPETEPDTSQWMLQVYYPVQ
ncbi:MAG: SRPBCC family protein [Bacteroidales bacterium]|nr:SRPBCC family protein [Bacteroidales bacterium]